MIIYYQIALIIACAVIFLLSYMFRSYRQLAELEINRLNDWVKQLEEMLEKEKRKQ